MRTVAAVVALVACVHAGLWALSRESVTAPNFTGQLASVSYAPFDGATHPDKGGLADEKQIRADLKALAPMTRAIRTYSSTAGVELVPGIASEFGLRVTIGAWIDKNQDRNEREIRSVIDLAKRHSNVNGIFVGNETVYRDDIKIPELISLIQKVKRQTNVPVTTGEIWSVWRDHPELVSAVDYIAVHILPYWEGVSDKSAVEAAIGGYEALRRLYPGKRIVIAEFGWPSAGYNFKLANPGRMEQATIIRDFVSRADAYGIDYNIVEAIDQPWKTAEGGVGPYWGLWDASRHAKFSWTGEISSPDHWRLSGIALLIGVLMSLPILRLGRAVTFSQAMLLVSAANAVGAWVAFMFGYWNGHYFVPGAVFALTLGSILLLPLIIIALARIEEIAVILFGHKPKRLIGAAHLSANTSVPQIASPALVPDGAVASKLPKVSIHIPAYREPPDMLKQTLDSLARLDYANFEAIVIINNTPDPAFWMPIEEHCKVLGDRFKFVRADSIQGFKAGALRLAMIHTAADAEIIGILDADYVVQPDWLKDLMPMFADPKVGLVQAPQDHRDDGRSVMHTIMNTEYAGFFDIGMVQRNEANAIITHGTMCLIRRTAMEAAGGWSSDTICEDSDLGLTILELGWTAHYTNRRYGHGLLPDTYEAFKKQRDRWAYGGFQIIKKHWRHFLPGAGRLTRNQKREYTLGWLNWLGAESVGVVVAILNLLWVPVVAFLDIAVPDRILTLPIVASFLVSMAHFLSLYTLRVQSSKASMFGSMFAAMSVQWTVARAVGLGLVRDHLPFVRTDKGGKRRSAEFPAFWEAVMAALLILGAIVLVQMNLKEVREINLFAAVLVIQSLPFIAAAGIALLERTPVNDYATWRTLSARLAARTALFSRRLGKSPVTVQVAAKQPEIGH